MTTTHIRKWKHYQKLGYSVAFNKGCMDSYAMVTYCEEKPGQHPRTVFLRSFSVPEQPTFDQYIDIFQRCARIASQHHRLNIN